MSEIHDRIARRCSDQSLVETLQIADEMEREGICPRKQAVEALRSELERRRADPNSSLFRPTFL